MFVAALGQFGGSTSDMPEEPITFNLLSWLKAHVKKLPAFVGGAADFGALAGGTNYVKMLARGGCIHTEIIKKEKLSGPFDLGETSPTLRRSIRNFMSSFWVDFGRAEARKMAEDRRAEVCALSCTWFNFVLWLCLVLLTCFCSFDFAIPFTGVAEGAAKGIASTRPSRAVAAPAPKAPLSCAEATAGKQAELDRVSLSLQSGGGLLDLGPPTRRLLFNHRFLFELVLFI
jgi:hypothetical protein